MVEGKANKVIDYGTRQWTPEDDLHSARMGLQRRLDTQRARRNVSQQRLTSGAATPPRTKEVERATPARITLSYQELLTALSHAASTGRAVTLTLRSDNVYLSLAAGGQEPSRDRVASLAEAEQAVRDRLEANLARRHLELHGIDHIIGDDTDREYAEPPSAEGPRP